MTDYTMMEVLKLTGLSMTIVFLSLIVISFILDLFKVVFKERKPKTNNTKVNTKTNTKTETYENVSTKVENLTKQDRIALFTAAIAASNGKKTSNIRIKSIKKVS